MLDEIILKTEEDMQVAVETMDKRLLNIRAGRANPAILNGVTVEYYGTPTPLNQLATIAIPEARQLSIKPFDKSCLSAIILNIPALTEETRRDYVKQAKGIAEDCKIALRNVRQDANNDIKKATEGTEDDKKAYTEDVQELINKYNKVVEEKLKIKEEELMSV